MIEQIFELAVLALPVACISWTVAREEIFREPRECLLERSRSAPRWWQRKFCYVWTCEYCFSHYVAAATVFVMDFWLIVPDWRGYIVAWLSLVAVANVLMSSYSRLRVEINRNRAEFQNLQAASKRAG